MTPAGRPGEIVTFYSYKGGTGRSMLLANVAWILACNGKRVLAIDWDLEAPGLHRYFSPFLLDRELTSSDGVVDYVIDFSLAAISPPADVEHATNGPWFRPYANILRYAVSLDWEFPQGGALDFVGAGRQGPSYSTRVNSFDWQKFYDGFGGGTLLEEMKRIVKEAYDYIIVDSRTGVSDTSGICTLQLPDTLVVCFTLNNQSIEGAAAVVESVDAQRREQPVRVMPVPMRVENSEKVKLDLRKARARERFGRYPGGLRGADLDRYWADVEVLYVPFYAYEEILATFGDRAGERHSILASAERITGVLTNGEIERTVRPSEGRRLEVLAAYEGTLLEIAGVEEGISGAGGIYISYRRDDAAGHAGRLYDDLSKRLGPERVFIDFDTLSPGADFVDVIEQAVTASSVVLVVIGPNWLESADAVGRRRLDNPDDFVQLEIEAALQSDTRVIPTLVGGARMPSTDELPPALTPLARRQAVELSDARWSYDIENLQRVLDVALTVDRLPLDVATKSASAARAAGRSLESEEQLFELLEAQGRLDRVRVWGRVAVAVIGVAAILGLIYLGYELLT